MIDHADLGSMDRQQMESYVYALEILDGELERLMDALPECPDHGRCVPYALAWITKAGPLVTLEPHEIPRLSPEQEADVSAAFALLEPT